MADQLFRKKREKRLKREEKERVERPRILIVCEDEKSSCDYLKMLCRQLGISAKVKVDGEGCGSAPISVVNYAITLAEHKDCGFEHVFCVIDRDKHDDFDRAIDKASRWLPKKGVAASSIRVITSFPCFEYWLLLHFRDSSKPYLSCEELLPDLNAELEKYGQPKYSKGIDKNCKFFLQQSLLELAAGRAETLNRSHARQYSSTELFELYYFLKDVKLKS